MTENVNLNKYFFDEIDVCYFYFKVNKQNNTFFLALIVQVSRSDIALEIGLLHFI